jgi:ASC-1-like (ASCH) protein
MTWNERKNEMSDGGEKTIEDRLRDTEDRIVGLSDKIESVRKKSEGIITDLRSVHTEMQVAIANFKD